MKMNLVNSNDKNTPNQKEIGGKSLNLFLLKKSGFLVPGFIVINSKIIDNILFGVIKVNRNQIYDLFNSGFSGSALEQIKVIREKIINAQIPSDLVLEVLRNTENFKGKKLILRSSASAEDGKEDSFAGIYESKVIDKNTNSVIEGIKVLLLSSLSERLFLYLKMKNIKEIPKLSIIVQDFVEGQISGVLFTTIKKGAESGTLINSNFGLAESVVQGSQSDSYFIPKDNMLEPKIKNSFIGNKSLKNIQITALVNTGKQIEDLFHSPQDIEWTISNSKVHILQSRPITTPFSRNIRVWDNSNIAESYSSIVLPLTISFARDIYKRVYMDVARTSGVTENKIREYEDVFENLLGFFYGRFYYNILNWYTMLTLFPGYERNKRNLDQMISAKSKTELDEAYIRNVSLFFKIKYYMLNLTRYSFSERTFKGFKLHVKNYHKNIKKVKFDNKNAKELLDLYYDFRRELINKWSITIDNDFLAMTFFGELKKFCQRNGISEPDMFRLLSNIYDVISADQVNSLTKLAKTFSRHKGLTELAKSGNYEHCYKEINSNVSYRKLKQEIENYLNVYSGRFSNELKLEAPDLDTNPEFITKLLFLYSKPNKSKTEKSRGRYKPFINLSLSKRMLLSYLTKKTKHYLKYREEFRLLRSQAFSHTRRLFNTIGKRFKDEGVLDDPFDVFYLEVDDIKNYIEGCSSTNNLQLLVNLRKKEYEDYKLVDLDNVFVTEHDVYSSVKPKIKTLLKNQHKIITGQGCSSGIVKGRVKVLEASNLPEKSGTYEIIVAQHTDPGWTPLFGLCKGIIVEHGGVLSHAAIISRELNLPCIVGVKNATKIFRDGQVVLMNGSSGEVKIET